MTFQGNTPPQVGILQAIAKVFTDTGKVRFDGLDGVYIVGE
jgi:hypothetical protein